jgi:hypothetical protein
MRASSVAGPVLGRLTTTTRWRVLVHGYVTVSRTVDVSPQAVWQKVLLSPSKQLEATRTSQVLDSLYVSSLAGICCAILGPNSMTSAAAAAALLFLHFAVTDTACLSSRSSTDRGSNCRQLCPGTVWPPLGDTEAGTSSNAPGNKPETAEEARQPLPFMLNNSLLLTAGSVSLNSTRQAAGKQGCSTTWQAVHMRQSHGPVSLSYSWQPAGTERAASVPLHFAACELRHHWQ